MQIRKVHPFATLSLGPAFIILGIFCLYLNSTNRVDSGSRDVQSWPSFAIKKLRSGDRSSNKLMIVLVSVLAACVGIADVCLIMASLKRKDVGAGSPYRIATVETSLRK